MFSWIIKTLIRFNFGLMKRVLLCLFFESLIPLTLPK